MGKIGMLGANNGISLKSLQRFKFKIDPLLAFLEGDRTTLLNPPALPG